MKIRTRLKISTWISAVLFIIMVAVLAWSLFESSRTYGDLELINMMGKATVEKVMLRNDYLLHGEERIKIQWLAKAETFRGLLDKADALFTHREDKALLKEARKAFEATFTSFSEFLDKHERKEPAAETILINQVFLKAYMLSDNIEHLDEAVQKRAKAEREREVFILILFILGGIVAVIFNTIFLRTLLARKVATLTAGIKIIGDGNLDYQIVAEGDDELADLARLSNETTARLKQSYTSLENLRQEIVERHRAEEKFSRTNRMLAVINQINQMVIRTHEQNQLFAEVCRITVEYGKFRMAWVGLIDEQEKTVKPMTLDGLEEGYLTKIKKISTNDIPEGRGPTGTAAREGKISYCNDIANDPLMTPWREDALQYGYRSSIALPIILQNRVIGALTIYDADQFFFNEAEINQLNEVTGNVNYAIGIMEIEKKRHQAEDEIKLLNKELEVRVVERTAQLSVRTAELERINKVFVGRELRMIELKKKIAELEKRKA